MSKSKETDPKRYSPYYHSQTKNVEFEEDRFGKWVKWCDVIPLLERSDNSGYTATPKVTSIEKCAGCRIKQRQADMEDCFDCFKEKLGNFA